MAENPESSDDRQYADFELDRNGGSLERGKAEKTPHIMKATELRIGNIVYQGALYGIDAVTAYQIYNFELLNKKVLVSDYYRSFSPVNLSEEWLLKFGFKKARTFDELNRWFIGENPVTKDWLFDIVWLDGATSPFYKNGYHQIQYVHQLQNLFFALTGTELEIKK